MADESNARPPWMPPDDSDSAEGPPPWDQEQGDSFLGQYILVGITYLASDGKTVTSQAQYHGRVTKADKDGVAIALEGTRRGETATLPPDLRAFRAARPGEYRLRSTGEVIKDPDLLTTWTITEPSKPS